MMQYRMTWLGGLLIFISIMTGCEKKESNTAGLDVSPPPKKAPAVAVKPVEYTFSYLQDKVNGRLMFEGTVEKTSRLPSVSELNYDELLSTIKVKVDKVISGAEKAPSLVVQIPVMRERQLLPSAKIAAGDRVVLTCAPWSTVIESVKTTQQVDTVQDYSSPVYYALAFERSGAPKTADWTQVGGDRKAAIEAAKQELQTELNQYGKGDWEAWRHSLAPFYESVAKRVTQISKNRFSKQGLVIEASLPTEIVGVQTSEHPGIKQIISFERALRSRGIDLIFVSIPRPWMIYPEDTTAVAPASPYVTPNYRQNLLALLEADVEVVDTLPSIIAAKDKLDFKFYRPQNVDLHPPIQGMEMIANLVAERLERYGYAKDRYEFLSERPVSDGLKETQIVSGDGVIYRDNPNSPILVVGDSTIRINYPAPSAGFSGRLAKHLGMRPQLLQRDGFALPDLARESATTMAGRQVVVWVAWSICLTKVAAPKCWEVPVNWDQTRVLSDIAQKVK